MVILGEQKVQVVLTTARKSIGKVELVSTLSMKRVSRRSRLYIYVEIVGKDQEDRVGIPIPPKLVYLLGALWIECHMSFQKLSH